MMLIVSFAQNSHAYLLVGVNSDYQFALNSNNPKGDPSGKRIGLYLSYGEDAYFGSLKLYKGDINYTSGTNASDDQTDLEIMAGYRIKPNISAFLGYRQRSLDFSRSSQPILEATEKLNHLGGGGAITFPIPNKLIVVADAKLYILTSSYNSDALENSATGYSIGTSVGLLRKLRKDIQANLSGVVQMTNTEYETGGSYTDTMLGVSIGVSRLF